MEPTICGECGEGGGRFILVGETYYHKNRCRIVKGLRDDATNPFQFQSMHISENPNDGPIRVQSLNHLRRLEREHGVQSFVGNYDNPERGGR